jgi:hypothetical protein
MSYHRFRMNNVQTWGGAIESALYVILAVSFLIGLFKLGVEAYTTKDVLSAIRAFATIFIILSVLPSYGAKKGA